MIFVDLLFDHRTILLHVGNRIVHISAAVGSTDKTIQLFEDSLVDHDWNGRPDCSRRGHTLSFFERDSAIPDQALTRIGRSDQSNQSNGTHQSAAPFSTLD